MKQKLYPADIILFFIFLSTVFLLAFNKIHDSDAWMHLSLGRLLWETKGWPAKESFVYTLFDTPFSYTSWLFAILFYLAYLAKGVTGLVLLKAIPVTTAFFFLLRDSLRPNKNATVAVIILFMAVLIATWRFVLRPDIFLMLFLASTIFILNSFLYNNEKRGLYFLPVILLCWANIHTSVNLIVVPVGAFVVGSYLQRLLNQRGFSDAPFLSNSQIRFLLILFGISLLLSLLNPNGIGQYLAGVRFIGADYYKQEILELMPPTGELKFTLLLLAGLICFSFFLNPKNISIPHLLLVLPFLVMPFMATRFIFLMGIAGGPIVARNIACFCMKRDSMQSFVQGHIMKATAALAIIAFGVLYLQNKTPHWPLVDDKNQFGVGFDESTQPSGAVAFMDREGINGRVFNTFSYGQYIIWTGHQKRPVFIDARGGLPMDLLEKNSRFRFNNAVVNELFEKFRFESMLVQADDLASSDSTSQKLDKSFQHPDWALVYWDNKSLLYLKRNGAYQHVIDKFEYRYVNPDTKLYFFANSLGDAENRKRIEDELIRNITETGSTKARLFLGALYYSSRQYEKAINVLETALSGTETNAFTNNVYAILGDIYFTTGNLAKSLEYYQKAPGYEQVPGIQLNIGTIYYRQGEIKKALSHFEQTIKLDKDFIQGYSSLIAAYRATGQEQKALALQPAYNALVSDQAPKMHFEKGLIAQQENNLDLAISEYLKSLEANPAAPVVCTNLGFAYLDKKQPDRAFEYFMKAINLQASAAEAHYGLALIYKEKKITDKAIEHFEKYCELEPDGYFYRTAREQIQELKR